MFQTPGWVRLCALPAVMDLNYSAEERAFRSVLRSIQRSPERVRAYFKPEPVRYAA